jgi:hypothetical protein
MKIILTIIGLAVGMIQTVAYAAQEPAWSLEGRSLIADSCGVECHCVIGGPPDNGVCQFVWIGQIDNGQYGGVKLDGVKFAQAGEWARKTMGEQITGHFIAFYIDSGASAEQREALHKMFAGPSFAPMGQPAELKEMAINFENLDAFGQVGKTASATVGEIAKVQVTPIGGNTDPNKPMVVQNGDEPGSTWKALGKASNSFYRSAGYDFKFDGTSGESDRFAWKGGGEK